MIGNQQSKVVRPSGGFQKGGADGSVFHLVQGGTGQGPSIHLESGQLCSQQSYAQILGESLNLPRDLFSNEEINPGADPCRSAGVAVPRALSVLCSGEGAEGGPSGEREEALLGHRMWHQRTFCAFTLKIL